MSEFTEFGRRYTSELRAILEKLDFAALETIIERLLRARTEGRSIYTLGNGGSAATAAHLACDLGKNTAPAHGPAFRVMCLNDNVPVLTALANDIGYDAVFDRQLRMLAGRGDVVVAMSASGNSPNVVNALKAARELGAVTIALLGFDGGAARRLVDVGLVIDSFNYGQVEDAHLVIGHLLTQHLQARIAVQNP